MSVPPTLVSTFELLFSPQLPPGIPIPAAVQEADENVVKAYFLTIANPNSSKYVFDVGFHCNPDLPATNPGQRTLASAVGFIDDTATAIAATISATSEVDFTVSVTVASRATVLLGIIPAFFNATGLAPATIDCRGWVDLTLPALFERFEIVSVPQASAPVPVIVTAEQRLTFLPVTNDPPTTVEAQSAFALPLAGGSSLISVPPQPGRRIILEPGVTS
jgi:hypothetical protein